MKRPKTPAVKKPAATRTRTLAALSQESGKLLDELIRWRRQLPVTAAARIPRSTTLRLQDETTRPL